MNLLYQCYLCNSPGGFLCEPCAHALLNEKCRKVTQGKCSTDSLLSPHCYTDRIGQIIQVAKQDNRLRAAWALAKYTEHFSRQALGQDAWDLILPVPSRWRSLRSRGFHLPRLLASAIAKSCMGRALSFIECYFILYSPFRLTLPQKYLLPAERLSNAENAFFCLPISLRDKSVLIVDDVISTGSTLANVVAKVREHHPARLEAFCLAHSHRHVSVPSRYDQSTRTT
ncbi:MAG: ComF family protein [Bdellovibrionales bacterium]|nr:ComF family protein [Bdellovibrionales bacterium]